MKLCCKCKKEQTKDNSYKRGSSFCHLCKECWKLVHYSIRTKARIKELNEADKDKDWKRYSVYKNRAKTRNIEFEITLSDFINLTKLVCKYCGQFSVSKLYCGVDRVDSSKGYILNNCVSCCVTCNFMKKNYTTEVFINHIKKILSHYEC